MSIATKLFNEQDGAPFIVEVQGLYSDATNNSRLDALREWKDTNSEFLKDKLLEHGAVLLRNFAVNTVSQFDEFLRIFKGSTLLDYTGGNSPRTKLSKGIYTSTEFPAEQFISLHNELSYSDQWPSQLFFCCETEPGERGNTLIADGRKLLKLLDPEIVEMFEKRKVKYIRNLHGGNGYFGSSWQDTFETQDRDRVSDFCKQSNIEFEWKDDGSVRISETRAGVQVHPLSKEKAWFNQADQFHASNTPPEYYQVLLEMCNGRLEDLPSHACFGDGGEIPDTYFDEIRSAFKELTIYFPWQKGDVLVVDNVLMAHGRAPYSGPRKILVAMS